MEIKNVLCVCTGNICRSPLAEGLIRRDASSLNASSAGIAAVVGGAMPAEAAEIAARENLDLADHRGRQISEALIRDNDLILVMEDDQKQWLTQQFPQSRGRVFLATHWRDGADIADPYRRSSEVFDVVFSQLAEGITDWLVRVAP